MTFLLNLISKIINVLGMILLPPLERFHARLARDSFIHPPIFLLGAPRSGTTLTMQVITDVFDIGYLSNSHTRYSGAPGLAEKFIRSRFERQTSNYRSNHGVTEGGDSPSEASQWWYRFFRRYPRYVDLNGINVKKMINFRKSVQSFILACDKPVLYKNPHAALRIKPIVKYIPKSLFIIVHRDIVDNAHSLLEVRQKLFSNYNQWWSMEPPAFELLKKLPAHEQVVEQVKHIYSTIEMDLRASGVSEKSCFHLNYESLCNNPGIEMERLEAFLLENNCLVQRRFEPPKPFEKRKEIRIDERLYARVCEYANKL